MAETPAETAAATEATADAAPWLRGLNPSQREAVLHGGGPLLVVAGAGTGKTRTLVCRVARLVAAGTPPDRILLLTFTRRAAREMLDRARRLTATAGHSWGRPWGGTFHSVANRIVREYAAAVGLWSDFTVLDQSDAADLFGLVRAASDVDTTARRFPRKETLAAIYSRTVNAGEPLSDVLDRHYPWCREHADAIRDIVADYTDRKRTHNVCDYDDLLLYWRALLDSPAADAIRARFDHVLVDEYQDTNDIQGDIVSGMCEDGPDATVVGDDAQAIYSFRGASVDNMRTFPDRFAGTTVVTLEQNYRSTRPILDAANAVMDEASGGFAKHLWSTRASDRRPLLVTCADEAAEAIHVCERVLSHREDGVALRDQAVLFRAGHHSDRLEIELARRDIPFVKYGGLAFLEAAHVKDLVALLRLLDNPRDALAWHRSLLLLPGVGPATARRVMDGLGVPLEDGGPTLRPLEGDPTNNVSGSDAEVGPLRRLLDDPPDVPSAARNAYEQLREALRDCAGDGQSPAPATQVERLRDFCAEVFAHRYDDVDVRLHDLDQLAAIAGGYRDRAAFLADLVLDPPASTSDLAGPPHKDDDWLVLSTIHSAKGGEWSVVQVIHASDGNIPSDMALGDREGVEEERRLLYVAMTRAKDALYISHPLRYYHHPRRLDDAHSYAQPSRFLSATRPHVDTAATGAGFDGGARQPGRTGGGGPDRVADYVAGLFGS